MKSRLSEQGIVILAMLAIIVIIITASIIASISLNRQKLTGERSNMRALALAKDALLGYAAAQIPPGILPCPDTSNDGFSNVTGNTCVAQRGRLPYKSLGIPDQKDDAGETLWYAMELNYASASSTPTLNSSTLSSITLNTTQFVAALVIAPGRPTGNQVRGNNNVTNFLEGLNANSNTRTYEDTRSATINDIVLGISISEYWSTMEMAVLAQAKQVLLSYRDMLGCTQFPWAASAASTYNSVPNLQIGFLPWGTATSPSGSPNCATTLASPLWLKTHWGDQLRYAFCGGSNTTCLSIAGDINTTANALIIAPGTALNGQLRPSTSIGDYFDAGNNDSNLQFEYRNLNNFGNTFNDVLQIIAP